MFNNIERKSLTEQAYDMLKNDILTQKRKPGEKLVILQICKEHGLSNTPVREAINRLQQEKLVINRVNSGFFVAKLDWRELKNYATIIRMLELGSIDILIDDGRIKDVLPELYQHLELQKKYFYDNKHLDYLMESMRFNRAFILHLDNKELTETLDSLTEKFIIIIHKYLENDDNKKKTIRVHEKIIECIEKGSHSEMRDIVKEHFNFNEMDIEI